MRAKALNKIAHSSIVKLDKPISTEKQLDAHLLKYAKLGFTNAHVIFKRGAENRLIAYLMRKGFNTLLASTAEGPFAEVEW